MSLLLDQKTPSIADGISTARVEQADPLQAARERHAHVPALDGIRGLAILLVLFIHTSFSFGGRPAPTAMVDRIYQKTMLSGWCGVDAFFVLSGFLITGILYSSREKARFFYNFYGRRVLRIFPLYYGFLLAIGVLLPLGRHWVGRASGEARPSIWYWLYLQNYLTAARGNWANGNMIDISWSLAIEEQFYLVWPLLVWLLDRRKMMWVCGVLILGVPVLRAILVHQGVNARSVYVLTPTRIDGLAVGAWIALAMRGPMAGGALRRWAALAAILGIGTVAALWITQDGFSETNRHVQVLGYSALAIIFGSIVVASVSPGASRWVAAIFSTGFLRFFGRYSYGLYLLHLPVLGLVRDGFFQRYATRTIFGLQLPMMLVFQLTVIAGSVLVAMISWHLFEKRFLALKRYFDDRPSTAIRAAETG